MLSSLSDENLDKLVNMAKKGVQFGSSLGVQPNPQVGIGRRAVLVQPDPATPPVITSAINKVKVICYVPIIFL